MEKDRLSRKERERARSRAEILQAALELFSQKGYYNVSMQEIAERSEFSVGTIYKFFDNKEKLYNEILTQIVRTFYSALSEVLQEKEDEYVKIRKYLQVKSEIFTQNILVVRLCFAVSGVGTSFDLQEGLETELRSVYNQLLQKLAGVFENGIQKKIFRSLDPYGLALALDSISNAFLFYRMEEPGKQSIDTDLIEKVFFEQVQLIKQEES